MASSSEHFCLRWNDFESNISHAFREIRDEKDFFDVTLACEDEQIQAHKVILSACSPFFRTILRRNRHDHPLLYLKGVKYTEVISILNFMYHGEVNVNQEDLQMFLAAAEELRIKGLSQVDTDPPAQIHNQGCLLGLTWFKLTTSLQSLAGFQRGQSADRAKEKAFDGRNWESAANEEGTRGIPGWWLSCQFRTRLRPLPWA